MQINPPPNSIIRSYRHSQIIFIQDRKVHILIHHLHFLLILSPLLFTVNYLMPSTLPLKNQVLKIQNLLIFANIELSINCSAVVNKWWGRKEEKYLKRLHLKIIVKMCSKKMIFLLIIKMEYLKVPKVPTLNKEK